MGTSGRVMDGGDGDVGTLTFALALSLAILHQSNSLLLLPLLGTSLYRAYLEQGIRFRENTLLGNEPILDEYDFVVVGAGPGGCAVANRLSEVANWTVLVLEAGGDENIYTDIPVAASHWSTDAQYDWGYTAERVTNACLAMEGQRCLWPRGKVLGGSSTLNYMIYTRGHRNDYDGYAAAGNRGWSYDEVLPYFLRSERTTIPEYHSSPIHGHNGYLPIERVRYRTPLLDAFLEGGRELGYATDVDYAAATQSGFSPLQTTQRRGRRVSASKAYLHSVRHRHNLHVAIGARVTQVLMEEGGQHALGVRFVTNNGGRGDGGHRRRRQRTVLARKEVILSAGALNSPQLLMLSGIGPPEHLHAVGIPVVRDVPGVGQNLHEHYSFVGLAFEVNASGAALTPHQLNVGAFLEWLNEGRGPLTLPGGVEGLAYLRTKYSNGGSEAADYPDIEYIFAAGSLASDGGGDMRRSFGIRWPMYEQAFGDASMRDTWTVLPMLLHPRSTGSVRLRDRNPWHAPELRFDYFGDPHDMRVLVEGIRGAVALSETRAFRRLGTRLATRPLPECSKHAHLSDEYWACMATYFTATLHHQSGTCKMGPASDPSAVVDPELRVHGVVNLRVVDASVFPKVPGAHLYAPTLMVGEKAADMIKEAWTARHIQRSPLPLPSPSPSPSPSLSSSSSS